MNEDVLKVGVGIRDDIRALRKMADFLPASFVDLQLFVKAFGIEEMSFSKLMSIVFGVKISKRQRNIELGGSRVNDRTNTLRGNGRLGGFENVRSFTFRKEAKYLTLLIAKVLWEQRNRKSFLSLPLIRTIVSRDSILRILG